MAYNPQNANGQATMANSSPVVIASNQSAVAVDSELPAAAALADGGSATQSVPNTGAVNLIANAGATTVDRMRSVGNGSNSVGTGIAAAGILAQFDDVSPTAITENQFGNVRMSANRNLYGTIRDAAGNERGVNVTAANALTVDGSATTQPVSAASLPLPTGAATNAVLTGGTQVTKIVDSAGTNQLNIDASGFIGIQSGGSTGSASPTRAIQIGGTDGTNLRAIRVDTNGYVYSNVAATSTGGYTPNKLISAATTNATSIKASAGTIGYLTASNTNAAARYLKVYNKASAPTVGTDVPVHTFLIPGSSAGAGTNIPIPSEGIACSAGIAIAITTGPADSDTTAVAANEVIVNYGTI